jgi:hypothetical protein
MTESPSVEYKLFRRAATPERSYFVISFQRPEGYSMYDFVKISCTAFGDIMSQNKLEYFALGDPHLECNSGNEFSTDDSFWRTKFDDTFVPGKTLADLVIGSIGEGEKNEISFCFYSPRSETEKFFDPEGDYSHPEPDPEWYCEGRYVEE